MIHAVAAVFGPDTCKAVLSAPRGGPYRKITLIAHQGSFHLEKLTDTQAFHETLSYEDAAAFLIAALTSDFGQYTGWDGQWEHSLRVTKKGRPLTNKKPGKPTNVKLPQRQKNYLLPEGTVIEPLVDLGIFTQEGRVAASMADKYRQINRFVEQVDDATHNLKGPLRIIDFGCGKSYLTFILYYYFTHIRGLTVHMTGLDLKADVISHCNETARRYGYTGLEFQQGDISGYSCPQPPDMVLTLHACDTATDLALAHAIGWGARHIFSVPCCQHELNGQVQSEDLALLTRYGLIQERMSALMTDSIRGGLLEACGYKTQLLEFIDIAHTPKNLLIRARKANLPADKRQEALDQVERLIAAFRLNPTLYRILKEQGRLG